MSTGDNTPLAVGTPPPDSVPTIPEHTLLRRIGRGSYGEIWLARSALGAYRAVKIIHHAALQDHAGAYEREFAGTAKFEPISRQHDGLVQILQFGRGTNGQGEFFYYVMELADNVSHNSRPTPTPSDPAFAADYVPRTLAYEISTRAPLPASEVLQFGAQLGAALQFLHSQGLVHRDIKPSNIIFVGGQPKLADVGCVADLDNSLSAAGTVGYMPSEGPSTVSADLFSVGKVLYEAATGKDRQDFPDLPSNLIAGDSKPLLELNEIWLKACANNPAERYDSATCFLSDLNKLRAGKSLRTARVRKRHLALAAIVTGAMILATALAGLLRTNPLRSRSSPAVPVLLSEAFDAPELDPNLWTIATNAWPGLDDTGKHQFNIVQTNGELSLTVSAQHKHGYSTYAAALATLQMDFHKLDPCIVEIELAGTTDYGELSLRIGDGNFPVDRGPSRALNPNSLLLTSSPDHTNWNHARVAIEFIPDQQSAVLYADAQNHQHFEILDLAHLPNWRLSFQAEANSSAVCSNGLAELRLRRLHVSHRESPRPLIGHVTDALSGWPLAEAEVVDQLGHRVARTQSNGAFMLTPESWPLCLRVLHDAYQPSKETLIDSKFNRPGHLRFELHKQAFGFGDVVVSFHYGDHDLRGIAFVDGRLMALEAQATNSVTDCLLVPVDFAGKRLLPATQRYQTGEHPFGSFIQCGDGLLATSTWPGRAFDLGPTNFQVRFRPTDENGQPMKWPYAAAFDGTNLWVLEIDLERDRVGLTMLNLQTGRAVGHLRSSARNLTGLAWDPGVRKFWISNLHGSVRAFDPREATPGATLDAGLGRSFRGHFVALAFGEDHLWGLDRSRRQICKIKVRE